MSDKDKKEDDGKHRDKEQEKRDADGRREVKPDIVREPRPGKRGK